MIIFANSKYLFSAVLQEIVTVYPAELTYNLITE